MESLSVALWALVLLVVALGAIIGSLIVNPALLALLAVALAGLGLAGTVAITRV